MSDLLLLPIRPVLHRAINAIEAFYKLSSWPWSADWDGEELVFGRAEFLPEELMELYGSDARATLEALARQVWEAAVTGNETTVWFIRNFSPEASILFLLCAVSDVPLGKILDRELSEAQFHRLTSVMARLTNSPLFISETPEDDSFGERLGLARWGQGAEVGICDWVLSEEELNAALRSGLRVLAPSELPESE
jgi:hypothetical protein